MSDVALYIPETLYEALRAQAHKHEQTPDALAVAWLTEDVEQSTSDPLASFAGFIESGTPNWIEQHDLYFSHTQSSPLDEQS